MYLKRVFDSDGSPNRVKVLHAGPKQKFWGRIIKRGLSEGWLEQTPTAFILKGVEGDVLYRIDTSPGELVNGQKSLVYHCYRQDSWVDGAKMKGKKIWQILSTT
jgi:hypothetical protein